MSQHVTLRPLQCTGCGALVSLGQSSHARCAYCGSTTPVPDAYVSLQRAAKSFADDRRLARELYGRVGRPPGWILRSWARGAEKSARAGRQVGVGMLMALGVHPVIGGLVVIAAAYVVGFPVAEVLHAIDWAQGLPRIPISPVLVLPMAAASVTLLIGLPIVLIQKERALAPCRRDIHASFAAALPERPGGPSRCRFCGAPLDVPPGALGVPCSYCRADNIVGLPRAWVQQIQASEFQHFIRIDAALDAYRDASRAARERLWKLAFGLLLAIPAVLAVAWLMTTIEVSY